MQAGVRGDRNERLAVEALRILQSPQALQQQSQVVVHEMPQFAIARPVEQGQGRAIAAFAVVHAAARLLQLPQVIPGLRQFGVDGQRAAVRELGLAGLPDCIEFRAEIAPDPGILRLQIQALAVQLGRSGMVPSGSVCSGLGDANMQAIRRGNAFDSFWRRIAFVGATQQRPYQLLQHAPPRAAASCSHHCLQIPR